MQLEMFIYNFVLILLIEGLTNWHYGFIFSVLLFSVFSFIVAFCILLL